VLEVLIDKYGIRKEGEKVLTSPIEYANSWNEIIKFINNEDKETIILRLPSLEIYFQNLKGKFGNKIEIRQISHRYEWEKLIGFKLPFDIDDGKIAELLLSEEIEKLKEMENKKLATLCILTGITDFSDFTVEYSLMECILRDVEHKYPQLLNDIIDEIIKSLSVGRREFWQRLKEERNKKEALLDAMKSLIVKNYPSDSLPYKKYYKETLTYTGFDFPSQFSRYISREFKIEIKRYLNEVKNNSIFSVISGKLKEEWEVVCGFLKENPIQDESIISSLLRKALEYPEIYEGIQKYSPVSPPPKEISEENVESWIDHYFAFYLYTRKIGKPEDTENLVKFFEAFFLKHHLNSTSFFTLHSILTLRQKIEELLKIKRKVLLLVVDGLSYAYWREIERIFGEECSFKFSTLPTVTEINKQRILSGLLDLNETYKGIIERFYKDYRWRETDSDRMDLKDFLGEDLDFYIYWENQFDNYIHRPMTFEKRFKDHVEVLIKISKEIENFLEHGGTVLLVGDHGYTILPPKESNKIVFSIEGVKITHNRVLEVENGKRIDIPVENVYWVYTDVAIAQGYHYFNSLPRGGTHGGATPEEVIVPFLVLEKKEEIFKMLNFKLSEGRYLRRKKHEIRLIIQNPNTNSVKVNSMNFIPSILKIYSPTPLLLKSGENIMDAELDLRTITTEECKVFVEYEVNEKVYQTSFDIPTTGAIKVAFDEWE
jgi:hypothetical protein